MEGIIRFSFTVLVSGITKIVNCSTKEKTRSGCVFNLVSVSFQWARQRKVCALQKCREFWRKFTEMTIKRVNMLWYHIECIIYCKENCLQNLTKRWKHLEVNTRGHVTVCVALAIWETPHSCGISIYTESSSDLYEKTFTEQLFPVGFAASRHWESNKEGLTDQVDCRSSTIMWPPN